MKRTIHLHYITTCFSLFLATILSNLHFVTAAPYRPQTQPRHRLSQAHPHSEAHPIKHLHAHSHHNPHSETATSTVIISPRPIEQTPNIKSETPPEAKQEEVEKVEVEEVDENDKNDGESEDKRGHKLTPSIIVVQRVVDMITTSIPGSGKQTYSPSTSAGIGKEEEFIFSIEEEIASEDELEQEDSMDRLNKPPPDRTENPKIAARGYGRIEEGLITSQDDRKEVSEGEDDEFSGRARGTEREGERGREIQVQPRQEPCTSGPGPDDYAREEGMAILMGWMALVGVVGILAVAPAG